MQKALIFPAGAKKPMQIGAVAANTGSLGARVESWDCFQGSANNEYTFVKLDWEDCLVGWRFSRSYPNVPSGKGFVELAFLL